MVMGGAVSNISNNFLTYSISADSINPESPINPESQESPDHSGTTETAANGEEDSVSEKEVSTVCASSLTNYSEEEASLEISLYDGNKLREIRQVTLAVWASKQETNPIASSAPLPSVNTITSAGAVCSPLSVPAVRRVSTTLSAPRRSWGP